ncbi:LysR substrate-binding domain-containing protein [Solibacillus sp. FSL H8-0538]|uniref:LysR substrate-binding domain-containing protein n=1 Tax=Solibacillus sp. FSL H8-0538 TaxID=2921400 RepID=UPI0030F4F4F3
MEVVKQGSFSNAAELLFMSQPAVSQHVKQYEQELGAILFDRSTKKLRLTAAGRITFDYCLKMIRLQQELSQALDDLANEVKGKLTIGASYSYGEYILPQVIAQFLQQYPQVEPQIDIQNTSHIAEQVLNQQIDVGIVEGIVSHQQLERVRFAQDQMVLVANKPLKTLLGNETWIIREPGSGTRAAVERFWHAQHLQPQRLQQYGSTQLIKGAVMAGIGVSLLSKWTVEQEIAQQQLFVIDAPRLTWNRDFYCIQLKEQIKSKVVQTFIGFLTK